MLKPLRFHLWVWIACCCSPCLPPSMAVLPSACRNESCGDMAIPYPFGIGSDCGLPDYRIVCKENSSLGPGMLPFLSTTEGELQVVNFSNSYLTVNSTYLKAMPAYNYTDNSCSSTSGIASFGLPDAGPFVISGSSYFVVIGCRSLGTCTAASGKNATPFQLECSTGCYNEYAFPFCNDYSCCIASLPPSSRFLNLTGEGIAYKLFPGVCGFSIALSENRYSNTRNNGIFGAGNYGLDISWGILFSNSSLNCTTVASTAGYACSENSACQENVFIPGYVCNCNNGFRGDGYKNGTGCSDIDECAEHLDNCAPPPLGKCTNTKGSFLCNCTDSVGNGTSCVASTKSKAWIYALAASLSTAVGIIVLGLIFLWLWKSRELEQKKSRYFQLNGGLQLQEFVSSAKGQEAARLFSLTELERATEKFSDHLKIGTGGFGTVYKGTLNGTTAVAIKKSKFMQPEQVDQFVNEIIILSQINHRNIVRLLGCCLETQVPLLVYEFISNGTLSEHLQQKKSGLLLSWDIRLQIAIETAQALEYLHSAASPPIFHRDVKSSNILLDKSFTPKVSDFGASRLVPLGHTHVSTLVQGTIGYLDPEYFRTFQLTDRSDVYSFGVVLFELITSLKPYSPDRGEGNSNLAMLCCEHLDMGEFSKLIDPLLTESADSHAIASINRVAGLASKCLSLEGHSRPSMRDVFEELLWIRGSKHAKLYSEVAEEEVRPLLPYSQRSHTQREFGSIISHAEKGKVVPTTSSFSSGLGSLEVMMLERHAVSRR